MFFRMDVLENLANHRKTPALESLFKKETPTQVFSCEVCEVFKNTFYLAAFVNSF